MKRGSVLRRVVVSGVATLAVIAMCSAVALAGEYTGALCVWVGARGPATLADGPISIGTDHSVYAPTDGIRFSVVNHLAQPIWLVPALDFVIKGECAGSVFKEHSGQWEPVDCSNINRRALVVYWVKVAAGQGQQDDYYLGRPVDWSQPTTTGTYHLAFRYVMNQPPQFGYGNSGEVALALQGAPSITSQPFRVCACARCG